EAGRQIRLRVHVDAEDAKALFLERSGEIDRRGRLADPALLIRNRDHLRHRGITSKSCLRRDGSTRGRGNASHATAGLRWATAEVIHSIGELFTDSVDM